MKALALALCLLLAVGCAEEEAEPAADLCYSMAYNLQLNRWLNYRGKAHTPVPEVWEKLNDRGITRDTQESCVLLYVEQYQRGVEKGYQDAFSH